MNKLIRRLIVLCSISVVIFFHFISDQWSLLPPARPPPPPEILQPANSTLGFGTILAVSPPASPRRLGLLWAANLTNLDITIPIQPSWTDQDIANLRNKPEEGKQLLSRGSALAWLGHLHALRSFLSTSHETALIIEDDSDWDVEIRRSQVPLAAQAFRRVLTPKDTTQPSTPSSAAANGSNADQDPNFWSPTSQWSLLYLGHCDDIIRPSTYLSQPHVLYADSSVPAHHLLHPLTSTFLASLNVPEQHRLVHRAYWPLCTFAYAVTRTSAAAILRDLDHEPRGGCDAFDVRLLEKCRDEEDGKRWKCWEVAPELFHHMEAESEIWHADQGEEQIPVHSGGGGEGGDGDEGRGVEVEEDGQRVLLPERATWNIGCGARHRDMWVSEAEALKETRKWLVEKTRKGECLIDFERDDARWVGCVAEDCGAPS